MRLIVVADKAAIFRGVCKSFANELYDQRELASFIGGQKAQS